MRVSNLIEQIHQEEHVVVAAVLVFHMLFKTMRDLVELFAAYAERILMSMMLHACLIARTDAADEALGLIVGLDGLQLIAQLSKGVDDETLHVSATLHRPCMHTWTMAMRMVTTKKKKLMSKRKR